MIIWHNTIKDNKITAGCNGFLHPAVLLRLLLITSNDFVLHFHFTAFFLTPSVVRHLIAFPVTGLHYLDLLYHFVHNNFSFYSKHKNNKYNTSQNKKGEENHV